ncbi:hypothetical protein ULMS_07260 [Patiriisocius marinistellae]|uniref:WG repeat-containing protein n=1 Tax=Patiriisocius marinistellae TaxID=2494560 RepID=A0A5J4FVF6_9FLAO|nr:WG repeat-containing protein [Patiriisocius marinistellae]GEQ85218.1 hypothetical protein ULMS_07260 [Patiriisocius marinistellae]
MKKTTLFILTFMLTGGMFFAQELALVRENDQFGYIDTSGKFTIKPQFEKAASFSDGLAAAMKNDKWGFIDKSGNFIIEAKYDRVKPFMSGYALVLEEKQWNYIGKNGQVLQTPVKEKYYDFNEDGLAFYSVEKQYGLINTKSEVILTPSYDAIKPFVNGYARVKKSGKWGMIDKTGKIFVPVEYDEIGDYNNNGISVRKNDFFGILLNGKMNTISGADKVWDFPEGEKLTYARKDKLIGFVNNKGEWVIAPTFHKARAFSNGLAPVFNDDDWGFIDETGKEVIPFQYRDAETFAENGLAPVKVKKLWGFIDKSGKMVIPDEYLISAGGLSIFSKDNLKGFYNGFARVRFKKEWGFIDEKGNALGGKWYENAEVFSE